MSAVVVTNVRRDASGNLLAGERYLPRILGASAVAATAPADTNENILATITIPAGAMGLNGILRVASYWTVTNNANAKTIRVRFSGIGGTAYLATNIASTAAYNSVMQIANRGVANSQIQMFLRDNNSGAGSTSAVDTSVATTLVLTAQKGTAGDTMTLESYLVELILP